MLFLSMPVHYLNSSALTWCTPRATRRVERHSFPIAHTWLNRQDLMAVDLIGIPPINHSEVEVDPLASTAYDESSAKVSTVPSPCFEPMFLVSVMPRELIRSGEATVLGLLHLCTGRK